ncbi:MAG TPA: sigma-70 family RNA polymerase sigma factor [Polyangiaceae bacterium]|nr:sigma-70 family RNA polymerase sigma factor [Polyangiaceae bacterium]
MGEAELTPTQRRWIEQVLPRVHATAHALRSRISHLSEEDLVSAGYEGLIRAAQRYDPESGVPFAAYAHYRIRGAMLDAARQALPSIRQRSRALRALEATQALLHEAQRSEAAPSDRAPESLRRRVETASALVASATTAILVSRLAPADPDSIGDDFGDSEATLLDQETRTRLRAAIDACTPSDRALIEALYFQGLSMHEFASQIGKSTSTVSRHHARILGNLAKRLQWDERR